MALDGSTWDEANPTNSTIANQIDDYNRDLRTGVRGRMALEHIWPDSQTGTSQAGYHSFVTFQARAAAPTMAGTTGGGIWIKSSGLDLWFTNSAGTDYQVGMLGATQTFSGQVAFSTQPTIAASGTATTGVITYAQFTAGVPTGVIQMYAGTATPTASWYMCTGGTIDTSTDNALFLIIGTYYGTGAGGAGQFSVPDFTAFFPIGASPAATGAGQATVGQNNAGTYGKTAITGSGEAITLRTATDNETQAWAAAGSSLTPTLHSHSYMPPYLAVNFIIKR